MALTTTPERRRWLALAVVCMGQLMIVLDTTIVNVALPDIGRDLGFGQANLTWVVNAYLITFGSFLLLAGRLGDLFGRKKMFISGLALFTAASLLCGVAGDQFVLIAGRFLQGVGGAAASSVIIAIIVTEFPEPAERAKAMSLYTLVAVGGGSIGLVAGGLITQAIAWHWIFFINLPIGLAAMVLGWRLIEENTGAGLRGGVDWLGSALVTGALMLGVYAIVEVPGSGWASAHTLGFGGAAVAVLAAFAALQQRLDNPILPPHILRTPGLASSSVLRGAGAAGMFGCFFVGSLFLERVQGFGEVATGASFLPQTITVAVLSMGITARLIGRFGARRLLAPGMAATAAGLALLAISDQTTVFFPQLFFAFALVGLGAGTTFMPLLTIAMENVPARDAGMASGIVNVSMQVSAALGLAVLGTISADRTGALREAGHSGIESLVSGYQLAFWIAAGFVAAAAVLSTVLLPRERVIQPELELEPEPEREREREVVAA
jgi:EmrB/QacA subfamily drug resistance transporter